MLEIMKLYKVLLSAGLLAFAVGSVKAMECENVELPDTIEVNGQTLVLNGLGLRRSGLKKLHVSGLYLAERSDDAAAIIANDQPRRMSLNSLQDVSLAEVYEGWKKAIDENEALDLAIYQERLDKMVAAMTDFKVGQNMTFSYFPEQGTEIIIQGESKTVIDGADFASALISVWLGPNAPSDKFRDGLLGGPCP
jgi:hypothetical protein